jgi:hypothetical protein
MVLSTTLSGPGDRHGDRDRDARRSQWQRAAHSVRRTLGEAKCHNLKCQRAPSAAGPGPAAASSSSCRWPGAVAAAAASESELGLWALAPPAVTGPFTDWQCTAHRRGKPEPPAHRAWPHGNCPHALLLRLAVEAT